MIDLWLIAGNWIIGLFAEYGITFDKNRTLHWMVLQL